MSSGNDETRRRLEEERIRVEQATQAIREAERKIVALKEQLSANQKKQQQQTAAILEELRKEHPDPAEIGKHNKAIKAIVDSTREIAEQLKELAKRMKEATATMGKPSILVVPATISEQIIRSSEEHQRLMEELMDSDDPDALVAKWKKSEKFKEGERRDQSTLTEFDRILEQVKQLKQSTPTDSHAPLGVSIASVGQASKDKPKFYTEEMWSAFKSKVAPKTAEQEVLPVTEYKGKDFEVTNKGNTIIFPAQDVVVERSAEKVNLKSTKIPASEDCISKISTLAIEAAEVAKASGQAPIGINITDGSIDEIVRLCAKLKGHEDSIKLNIAENILSTFKAAAEGEGDSQDKQKAIDFLAKYGPGTDMASKLKKVQDELTPPPFPPPGPDTEEVTDAKFLEKLDGFVKKAKVAIFKAKKQLDEGGPSPDVETKRLRDDLKKLQDETLEERGKPTPDIEKLKGNYEKMQPVLAELQKHLKPTPPSTPDVPSPPLSPVVSHKKGGPPTF